MKKNNNYDDYYPMDNTFTTYISKDKYESFKHYLVDDRTKILIIGQGINSFDDFQLSLSNSQIESIQLEGDNEPLVLIDGFLYERVKPWTAEEYLDENLEIESKSKEELSKLSLLFIPPKMHILKYIVPKDCVSFESFSFCNNKIEEIVFHDEFLLIDDMCFYDCTKIKSIHLPKSIIGLGEYPLNISGLEKITVDPENKYFIVVNDALLTYDKKELITIPVSLKKDVFEIPEGVVQADEYIPGNNYVKKIIVPDSMPSFTNYQLVEGNSMMMGFPSLEECIVKPTNRNFVSVEGVLYTSDRTKLIYYPSSKKDSEYTILDSCTSIEISSFINPLYTKKVYIPNENFIIETLLEGVIVTNNYKGYLDLFILKDNNYALIDFDDIYIDGSQNNYEVE